MRLTPPDPAGVSELPYFGTQTSARLSAQRYRVIQIEIAIGIGIERASRASSHETIERKQWLRPSRFPLCALRLPLCAPIHAGLRSCGYPTRFVLMGSRASGKSGCRCPLSYLPPGSLHS
ncbi:MAG: hypothetical protein RI897_1057 [Verrucomicrobiota bacterium]|jgi:hypothetical protein